MTSVVGIDVGGTFTDLYFSGGEGRPYSVLKVPSTPEDPSIGVLASLEKAGLTPTGLDALIHGTTIATNAVIERRGARCALITTRGFRDVLELGRRDRPQMYGLDGTHEPLVPRNLRFEVTERINYEGQILVRLDEAELRELGKALKGLDVESIVISFMHAYANTTHEERAREILETINPSWELVTATSIVREYYEFERTSTAVIQGYLQPLVAHYARNLAEKLSDWGYGHEVAIMQSNGGVTPLQQLSQRAAFIVRSGPAAGVMAAARIAKEAGFSHAITGDMGGTSFDVAVVINGQADVAEITNLEFRIPLKLPMIDVQTIGAGGGSIAHLDRGGMLRVGPRSAGAVPGPAAYAHGGTEPTVTDANVVLGRINPDSRMSSDRAGLDIEAARRAVTALGGKLGLTTEEAAEAILAVVNQTMAGRIRLMSIARGLDPRDFAFVAFGGAGPLHGGALIREVGISTMLVPLYPGVLCALGCAFADLRYDLSQTLEKRVDRIEPGELARIMLYQRTQGLTQLRDSQIPTNSHSVAHRADMAYAGQIHTLAVDIDPEWEAERLTAAFNTTYRNKFGNVLEGIPVVVVNVRTVVLGVRANAPAAHSVIEKTNARPIPQGHRSVYFNRAWCETPIFRREELQPGMTLDGPAIIEQSDTTTVVEPDMVLDVDHDYNLLVKVK